MSRARIVFFILSAFCFLLGVITWSFALGFFSLVTFIFGCKIGIWHQLSDLRFKYRRVYVLAVEWGLAFILGVVLLNNISHLFFEFYSIPSSSMEPNLRSGDMVLVNKTILGSRVFESMASTCFRFGGFGELERGDVIVFNYPDGDSCFVDNKTDKFYYLKRLNGSLAYSGRKVRYQPVASRERYLKRIIGMPLDTISIRRGVVIVNGKHSTIPDKTLRKFLFDREKDSLTLLKLANFSPKYQAKQASVDLPFPYDFKAIGVDSLVAPYSLEAAIPDRLIFPFATTIYHFNGDNLGPILVPKRGLTIVLSSYTIPFYWRIIEVFEGNELEEKSGKIFINGKIASSYTFKQNYYWVMGDNRGHSFDSRYWGFVPENHILGVASYVLLSNDFEKGMEHQLRSERFFMPLR